MPRKKVKTMRCSCGKFSFNSLQAFRNHKARCSVHLNGQNPAKKRKDNETILVTQTDDKLMEGENTPMIQEEVTSSTEIGSGENFTISCNQSSFALTSTIEMPVEISVFSNVADSVEGINSLLTPENDQLEVEFISFEAVDKRQVEDLKLIKQTVISKTQVQFSKDSLNWYVNRDPMNVIVNMKENIRVCSCKFECSTPGVLQAHLISSHFGFFTCAICEQGTFKNTGTLKRHRIKYHLSDPHDEPLPTSITPALPQEFLLQNILSAEDEQGFKNIDLSLNVVNSPFRNSYYKMTLIYTTESLIQVAWISNHLDQIVQRNLKKLSLLEQAVYTKSKKLPRGRIPRYHTTSSLLARFFTFLSQFFSKSLATFAQEDILNSNYWNKFFLFLEHRLELHCKTISNLTDDLKKIIHDMQLNPRFYQENEYKIQAFMRYIQNYRAYLGVGETRIGFSAVSNREQLADMWTVQLEAGGLLADEEMQALVLFLKINFEEILRIVKQVNLVELSTQAETAKNVASFAFFSQAVCYHLMALALFGQRTQINENLMIDRFKYDPVSHILQYFPTFEKVARKTDGIVVMKWGLMVIYCYLGGFRVKGFIIGVHNGIL